MLEHRVKTATPEEFWPLMHQLQDAQDRLVQAQLQVTRAKNPDASPEAVRFFAAVDALERRCDI